MDSLEVPVPFVTAREAREMSDAASFNRLMTKIDAHIRKVAATGERELSISTVFQGRQNCVLSTRKSQASSKVS